MRWQLISGPISDQYGRRRILLVGVVAYIVMSAVCAASPSIEMLIAARFVQGLASGVGIVIAQAASRDVFDGKELIRFCGRLAVTGSVSGLRRRRDDVSQNVVRGARVSRLGCAGDIASVGYERTTQ
ncbi:MFS transporter [Streptomyces sp. NPDC091292]|uniref:MFS transporter n=1 Tax=Streptomyces sp. NPDC091292 TaxID=3365991 RepID=UPI00381E83CE